MLGKDWMWESSLITKEQKGFVILLTHSLTQELQKDSDIPETLSLSCGFFSLRPSSKWQLNSLQIYGVTKSDYKTCTK
jgi:hypothetical protein